MSTYLEVEDGFTIKRISGDLISWYTWTGFTTDQSKAEIIYSIDMANQLLNEFKKFIKESDFKVCRIYREIMTDLEE